MKSNNLDISFSTRRSIQIKEARDLGYKSEYQIELYLADKDFDQGLISFQEWEKRYDDIHMRHFGETCNSPADKMVGNLMMIALFAFAIWFFFDVFIFRGD